MKLASLDDGTRDGALHVVSRTGDRCVSARAVVPSLQAALDHYGEAEAPLRALAAALEADRIASQPLDTAALLAPLPRAYEWVDASAYVSHIVLVRKARGAEPPKTLLTDPLVYQGGSGVLLAPRAPLALGDPAWGLDLEGEVAVVLGETPMRTSAASAGAYVKLVMLANDITYRHLVPAELEKGFGFFQSKPATAFSPFAITPDEIGPAYRDGRVHLPLRCSLNGALVGEPDAGAMHFSFFDLIAHITRTRAFTAGTVLGSGTVSNDGAPRGVACLAERRMLEVLEHGSARTPFLQPGDRVRIEMLHPDGTSLFGAIEQQVVAS